MPIKLGFMTTCFPKGKLEDIVGWAAKNGFQEVEVPCWRYAFLGKSRSCMAKSFPCRHFLKHPLSSFWLILSMEKKKKSKQHPGPVW